MFQSRTPKTRRQKLRQTLWPSMGMRRLMRYYKHRIARLQGTPASIAGGFATGVAVSCTPFLGLHILLGLLFCVIFRFSKLAMVIGTVFGGNPWTIPLLNIASYELGHAIMGHVRDTTVVAHAPDLRTLFLNPLELLLPMSIGCLPLVALSWVVFFYLVRGFVANARAKPNKGGAA